MKKEPPTRFKTWFRTNFIAGIVILIPIIVSVWLFGLIFFKLTDAAFKFLSERYSVYKELYENKVWWYVIFGRVFVLLLMIAFIAFFGWFAKNFLGRRFIRLWERIFETIPIFNRIYMFVRRISHAFLGQDRSGFSHVVLVEYPRKGLYSIGFVTSKSKGEVQAKTSEDILSVFIATTPNPTSGVFILVPEKDVINLEMSVEDGFKMVISGGAVVPEYKVKQLKKKEISEEKLLEEKIGSSGSETD